MHRFNLSLDIMESFSWESLFVMVTNTFKSPESRSMHDNLPASPDSLPDPDMFSTRHRYHVNHFIIFKFQVETNQLQALQGP